MFAQSLIRKHLKPYYIITFTGMILGFIAFACAIWSDANGTLIYLGGIGCAVYTVRYFILHDAELTRMKKAHEVSSKRVYHFLEEANCLVVNLNPDSNQADYRQYTQFLWLLLSVLDTGLAEKQVHYLVRTWTNGKYDYNIVKIDEERSLKERIASGVYLQLNWISSDKAVPLTKIRMY